jgi:hypothetical protein
MTHPDHLASDDAANLARLLDASPTLAATAAHVRSFETSDARWFTAGDIPALPIRPAMRLRIGHALTPGRPCHIG